ncbi:MAG: TetR/AcrR family transcriptional regulator [Minwuia sp.]|uniref:TetR/AcrR family transcriptional regulator n=1 Tax=Minwuia sp. TaxID=2493630 RepID=UPI003A8A87D4
MMAAFGLVRQQGYTATSVDQVCAAAGVSKGAFFHHFKDKQALAVAAAALWGESTGRMFAEHAYHRHADPLDRVLGYLDLRRSLIQGEPADFSCMAGTMVQELHQSHPAIRKACGGVITGHAETLVADIQAAMDRYGAPAGWTAESLALHTQAVLQGAFIVAKASGDPQTAIDSIDHLKRYVELLFGRVTEEDSVE